MDCLTLTVNLSGSLSETQQAREVAFTSAWRVRDFIVVWLGGFAGTAILFALGDPTDAEDVQFVLALAGQYSGNFGALWAIYVRRGRPDLGVVVDPRDLRFVGLGLGAQIAVALLLLPIANLLFPDGQPPQEIAEAMANTNSTLLKASLVLAAVVFAPIAEELMFRGVLLRALKPRGTRLAVVVSSIVFSAVHLLGLDVNRLWQSAVLVLPPIFLLGVGLAWLTEKHGRLGPAMGAHLGWNLLATVILLAPPELLERSV